MGSCSGCRLHGGESRGKISSVVGSPTGGKPREQAAATVDNSRESEPENTTVITEATILQRWNSDQQLERH